MVLRKTVSRLEGLTENGGGRCGKPNTRSRKDTTLSTTKQHFSLITLRITKYQTTRNTCIAETRKAREGEVHKMSEIEGGRELE